MKLLAIVLCLGTLVSVVAYSWLIPALAPQGVVPGGRGMPSARTIMMIAVSAVALLASARILLGKNRDEKARTWAFGALGTLLGFWLKQP